MTGHIQEGADASSQDGTVLPAQQPNLAQQAIERRAINRQQVSKVRARRRHLWRPGTLAGRGALLHLGEHLGQHPLEQHGWQALQTLAEGRL
jgi:hypothetical protein